MTATAASTASRNPHGTDRSQAQLIHPFCITIDTEGLTTSHMYGAVNYTVIADVKELPLKVADIYGRLTR